MFARFSKTLSSFLFVILFDVIYSVLGIFVIDHTNTRTVSAVIAIALLCGLFFAGYMIGAKFFSAAKKKVVSIVIMPMILMLLMFGLGIIAVPVVGMLMQYPAVVLIESLGIDKLLADDSVVFYIIAILYHLLCCLSLLIGSYHKKHTQ